MLTVPLTG